MSTAWKPLCGCVISYDRSDDDTVITHSFQPCSIHTDVKKDDAHDVLVEFCMMLTSITG